MITITPLHKSFLLTLSMILLCLFFVQNASSAEEPAAAPEQTPSQPVTGETADPLTGRDKAAPLPVSEAIDLDPTGFVKQFEETTYYLKDVTFATAETGWAVGQPYWNQAEKQVKGTIIKTVDGGETWTAQESGSVETLHEVTFVDADNGWAVGADGTILHTSNGGAKWSNQTVGTKDEFLSVAFTDTNNGWAAAAKPVHFDWRDRPDNWEAAIWHTSNGGQSWTQQTVPAGASILRGLTFIDAQTGWVVGVKYSGDDQYGHPEHVAAIFHTSNGGSTWIEQYAPDLEVSLTSAHFIDDNNGWAAGFPTRSSVKGGFIFHTTNGGQSWERQEPGGIYDPLWDIQFIDANRGYAVGANYIGAWGPPVWRTFDGGDTWELIAMERHENDGLYGVVVTEERVVALGDHDYVVISDDPWGTYSWPHGEELFTQAFINTHYRFEDVFFADQQHGWAVGSRSFVPQITGQVIFHTQDGGENWVQQYEHAPNLDSLFSYHRLDSVYFVDNQNGWAVGTSERFYGTDGWEHHGAILHTTDGGQTWQEQGDELYEQRDREFFAVQFIDSQNGWALANKKFPSHNIHLAHSTDAGMHWEWVDTGIEGPLAIGYGLVQGDVVFTDAQHGWAAGGLGKVIHTADGGATWDRQTLSCRYGYPSCPWALFAIDFIDNQAGWLAGEAVYQTEDGGANWPERDMGIFGYFQDVQLFDDGTGWMVGERGIVMVTSNGGSRWHLLDSGTSFALRGLAFIERTNGWMAGDYGTILHFSAERLPIEAELLLPLVSKP